MKKPLVIECCQCHNRFWVDGSWQDLNEAVLLKRDPFAIEHTKCDKCTSIDMLRIAEREIGVHETPGHNSTARILEYHACTKLKATSDEVPWCSSFVNWVVQQTGREGTRSAMARSWTKWGKEVKNPFPGCVVVLKRGDPPAGHVGFFVYRRSPGGWVYVLGGNQSDQVKVSFYQESDVLAYRAADNIKENVS